MDPTHEPTVLVLGASGTVGTQVVRELEGMAVKVRIPSRKPDVVK